MDDHAKKKNRSQREKELLEETQTEMFGLEGADAPAPDTSPELQVPAPRQPRTKTLQPEAPLVETVELGQETDTPPALLDETATDLAPLDDAPEDPDLHLAREIEIVEVTPAEPEPDETDSELMELAEPEPRTFHDFDTDPEPDAMVPVAPAYLPIEPVADPDDPDTATDAAFGTEANDPDPETEQESADQAPVLAPSKPEPVNLEAETVSDSEESADNELAGAPGASATSHSMDRSPEGDRSLSNKQRFRGHVLLATVAVGVEMSSVVVALGYGTPGMLLLAGGLHIAAAGLSLLAARRRRSAPLGPVEKDLVFFTALLVPVFGPALAWSMPHEISPEKVENAHEMFERYEEHVKPAAPDYERTLFTGDYEKDLARELDAESYHEVLRHGSTDQKRNALRRLADLGEPKHFLLIRSCLLDPEHEVRLYAYSELDRSAQRFEQTIAKRSKEVEQGSESEEALLPLTEAYFDYAASGIQDEEMAAFYFRSAERFAARMSGSVEGVWMRAAALARLKEFEQAEAMLATLGAAEQAHPRSCVVRADIAFRRRDFAAARAEAATMRAGGSEPPPWLAALETEENRS